MWFLRNSQYFYTNKIKIKQSIIFPVTPLFKKSGFGHIKYTKSLENPVKIDNA